MFGAINPLGGRGSLKYYAHPNPVLFSSGVYCTLKMLHDAAVHVVIRAPDCVREPLPVCTGCVCLPPPPPPPPPLLNPTHAPPLVHCSCGAINFGMLDGQSSENSSNSYLVVMGVGIITCANAFFNCFVLCTHPDFKVKPPPPKAALTQDVRTGTGTIALVKFLVRVFVGPCGC